MANNFKLICVTFSISFLFLLSFNTCPVRAAEKVKKNDNAKEKWKKKDVNDYTDVDVERLFEQWEENDEDEKDPDDIPIYEKPKPQIDLSKLDTSNPESMIKMTKMGQPLMMFVSISGNPTREETETISQRWQEQLFNANIQLKRYVVGDDRILFHLDDGALAFDIKNFLIQEERCFDVSIDQQVFHGKGSDKKVDNVGHIVGAEKSNTDKKKKKKGGKKKAKKTDKKDEL